MNTNGYDDSPSDSAGYASNLGEEHENEEDEEFSKNNPEINDSIKSKISKVLSEEDVIIILLAKKFSLKVIKAFISSIDTY